MVYQSEKMTLYSVMKVFDGKVNAVEICEDIKAGKGTYYTVLIIKEHETVKKLMKTIEMSPKEKKCYVDIFDCGSGFCVVFDYVKERKLTDFYMARDITLETCEEICLNLVVQCMTSQLPFPLLELILRQNQLHLLKDKSIKIGYVLDLEEFDDTCTEVSCVMQCAVIVKNMLEQKISKRNVGYQLLEKKIPKQNYTCFRELYTDIRLATSSIKQKTLVGRIKAFFVRNDSAIFKTMIVCSMICVGLALVVLLSRLIFGDVPMLRFFTDTFEQIGTESLIN